MASTEFVVVSWSPLDPITDEKLDAMVNNDNFLRDTMVNGWYSGNSVNIDTGIRIACGLAYIPSGQDANASKDVSFENFFSESCKPIVTTGIVSASQRQIYATLDGPGSDPQPTRDGFKVHVYVTSSNKKKKITKPFYVSWHAMGY